MTDHTSFPPARVPPPGAPGPEGLLSLATGVVVIAGLYLAREVLIPITLAVLLSFMLAPVVELLRRTRLPRAPAVLLSVLLGLTALGSIGGIIGLQVAGLAGDVPRYAAKIETKVQMVRDVTLGRFNELANRLDRQTERAPPPPTVPSEPQEAPQQRPIPVAVQQPASDPLELAQRVLRPVLAPVESALIIFVVAVFILMQKEDLRDRLIRLFGSNDLHRTTVAMDDAAKRLSRYFLSQLAINACFGVVITIGVMLIGLPSPLLWGVLAGLLRFVPYIGALIAAALPMALAAAIDPYWATLVWTGALFAVAEGVMGTNRLRDRTAVRLPPVKGTSSAFQKLNDTLFGSGGFVQ